MNTFSENKFYRNRVLQHTLFWLFSFAVLLRIFAYSDDLTKTDFIYASLFHVPLVLGVYFNLYFLISKFLQQNKYIYYFLTILPLITLMAWLGRITFEHLVDYIFPGYYFISYYEFLDYALFAIIYLFVTSMLKLSKGWFQLLEAQQQLNRLKEEKLTTELQALKSQINPHFLFNSLNSIYSLSLDQDALTPTIILKLSELLRFMLYEANEEKVLLEKELHHLGNYIEIQKLRVSEQADILFESQGEPTDLKIAPLLLLPLVENGFKHGIKGDVENAFIHILYKIENNNFTFSVKNNKGQVDEVEGDKYKGIGLNNVQRRLELLYPNQYQLNIKETDQKFHVILQLTLEQR